MEEHKRVEVVNRDPSFGSSLLTDNFGQKPTDDDITALDPLKLEETAGKQDFRTDSIGVGGRVSGEGQKTTLDPLLQNPEGATQMFTDMHGISSELEGAPDVPPANTGMRHMAGLTVGAQRLGTTDWGSGTDGGRSGKPQDGVPYGSFVGV
ncbi:hypothetical protein M758_4G127900 [Ceratodon purpureus]|nr:hypothetical protein M758_4G127900 [Ceratodon purpureus]